MDSYNTQFSINIFKELMDNRSFTGSTKVHEYAADSCTTYGRVYISSSFQEAFVLGTRTLFRKIS